jgi:hypothetical protein
MEPNLFQRVEKLVLFGDRLNGEPEVLNIIEDLLRRETATPVVRHQIRRILEFVPEVFPENWQSPWSIYGLNDKELAAFFEIAKAGPVACRGPEIQRVIELAVEFEAECRKKLGADLVSSPASTLTILERQNGRQWSSEEVDYLGLVFGKAVYDPAIPCRLKLSGHPLMTEIMEVLGECRPSFTIVDDVATAV